MVASWAYSDRLDPMRIGIFGFSAGGLTALVAIGGVPDLSLGRSSCAANPSDFGCRTARETGVRLSPPPAGFIRDPRIAAAVIAAPLGVLFMPEGLASIKAPIQLWRAEVDELLPHPRHAQNVYDALATKPEYHVVPNAGHFVFLAPCTPALAKVAPEACRDPAGFDRATFHREFNNAVVAFFKANLRPQRRFYCELRTSTTVTRRCSCGDFWRRTSRQEAAVQECSWFTRDWDSTSTP